MNPIAPPWQAPVERRPALVDHDSRLG